MYLGQESTDAIGPPVKSVTNEKAALLRDVARACDSSSSADASWEAFVGKMASKGELLALDREEQIVVKQQMLDRLMLLERELQERTVVTNNVHFSNIYCPSSTDVTPQSCRMQHMHYPPSLSVNEPISCLSCSKHIFIHSVFRPCYLQHVTPSPRFTKSTFQML